MTVIEQWQILKRRHPTALLMFQLGDFYELFFDDARVAARSLNLTLTRRGRHDDQEVPMCGVPVASAPGYIARLAALGHSVAVADQCRDHDAGELRREITRVSTPATAIDEASSAEPRHLIGIVRAGTECAFAAVDVARLSGQTGVCDDADIIKTLGQFRPAEILAPPDIALGPFSSLAVNLTSTRAPRAGAGAGERVVIALVRDYVGRMQGPRLAQAIVFRDLSRHQTLAIDLATRQSLNLDGKEALLLSHLDRTQSVMGARLLASRMARPTCDGAEIERRQSAWATLVDDPPSRNRLRSHLKAVPDFERATARLVAGRPGPRDLRMVREGLSRAAEFREAGLPADAHAPSLQVLLGVLDAALDDAPVSSIRLGYDPDLDETRAMAGDARGALAAMQAELAQHSNVTMLKIRHHAQLGYVAEVPASHAATLQACPGYILRQGLASAARFSHPELTRLGDRIAQASEDASLREASLLAALGRAVAEAAGPLMELATGIAELDVAQSAATLFQEGVWCRPELTPGNDFVVTGLRHPEIAATIGAGGFVPNDCDLSHAKRLLLLTGPNMAGKSTYLRQNAIAVVLAQAGLPVPASEARIGIVDALFSRIGASDDLSRGRSTFMVEMLEVAAILAAAGPKSFVVIDEIGRGTATQDGLAIAQAVLEALHDTIRCRSIFATHFLELGTLCAPLAAVQPCAMRVRQTPAGIVFLHEVVPGAASRSWGVHVASLAGVPAPIVARAAALLAAAERARPVSELPLFAADAPTSSPTRDADRRDVIREAVQALDPDSMSPRDALAALYALKAMVTE